MDSKNIFIQTELAKQSSFTKHTATFCQSLETQTKALVLFLTAALTQLRHLLHTPLKQNCIQKIVIRHTKHIISHHA